MKIKITFLFISLVLLMMQVFISGCNSSASKENSALSTNDTTAVIDTAKAVAVPAVDSTLKSAADSVVAPVPLTLIITNLAEGTGPVNVGVYGTENKFPDPKDQLKLYKFKSHDKQLTAKITNLPFGTYALAIYQDVNDNGKIDKNLIGVPTEPYAFSNNYKPTVKAPNFNNCKFDYQANADTVKMKMIR